MTNQEIFEKVIAKAKDRGWNQTIVVLEGFIPVSTSPTQDAGLIWSVDKMIFDHSFARAFWGEEEMDTKTKKARCELCIAFSGIDFPCIGKKNHMKIFLPAWQFHLRELALTPPEERLSYLERYL